MTRHQEKKAHSHKHAELQTASTISDNNKTRQSDSAPSSTNPLLLNKRILLNKTSSKTSSNKALQISTNSPHQNNQNKTPPVSANSHHQNTTPPVYVNSPTKNTTPPVSVTSPHKNKALPVSVNSPYKNKAPPVSVNSPTKKMTASQLAVRFGNIRLPESFKDMDDQEQGTTSQMSYNELLTGI